MRFVAWLLAAVLLILLGWIGGPVATTSYRAAVATNPDLVKIKAAEDLVNTYRRHAAGGYRLNLSIADTPPDYRPVRDCGYDPEAILKNENVPFLQSADWGFEVLQRRASGEYARVIDDYRADYLAEHHMVATMAALAECLDSPFGSLCRSRVGHMVSTADAAGAKDLTELRDFSRKQSQAILCTFLDGAAARRGIAKIAAAPKPTT